MNRSMTRSQFVDNAVTHAGPHQILTMLYDRLLLDISRAEEAQRDGRTSDAAGHLDHAGDVISGLASTLDIEAWSGGQGLMDLYLFLLRELMASTLDGDADRIARCGELVSPLREAWHDAAKQLAAADTIIPSPRTRVTASGESPLSGELGIG